MKQRIGWLLASLGIALAVTVLLLPHLAYGQADGELFTATAGTEEKMDAALRAAVREGEADTPLRYILTFEQKANLAPQTLPGNANARRREMVSRLQQTAAQAQAGIQPDLARLQASGQISQYRQLWITNGIAVRGTAASASQLAKYPGVQRVELDEVHHYFDEPDDSADSAPERDAAGSAWGIQQIRADKTWEILGERGAGVTVAVVDSGVELEHPELFDNYRGNQDSEMPEPEKNWFHTDYVTSTIPFDPLGHGTHVAGIAVGRHGIGVAPEANWIAVAIADEYGLIYDSNIYAAFQWLLAPGGDSDAAPDIANNSWGGAGDQAKFMAEVQLLHQAGIITVFAAGNSGPQRGTVLAPGSYPETITVGASDDQDQPAWFSGRGPSPLTDEIKPLLLAPGTQIRSAYPGQSYAARSGTSMATPHVAGTIALLLAANPGLSLPEVRGLLANTAVPLADNHPNYDSGWGRLDAYTSVMSLQPHGRLSGRITRSGQPLGGVLITVTTVTGSELTGTSDADGRYEFLLPPGSYDARFSRFGFDDAQRRNVAVVEGGDHLLNIALQQKPLGLLSGRVKNSSGQPLQARVSIRGTVKEVTTGTDGRFSFWFPAGEYQLLAQDKGYKLQQKAVTLEADKETPLELILEDGPAILLIDSGPVRYDSARPTYQEALIDAGYSSDLWLLDQPTAPLPSDSELATYDVVIWSAPSNSPGQLAASDVLTNYLGAGGTLLVSGQDVARLDGQPNFEEQWFRHQLQAEFAGEIDLAQEPPTINGLEDSPFAGLEMALNGTESPAIQVKPDHMVPKQNSFTRPVLQYAGGETAALEAGTCTPYRIIQLGFGLEGINGAEKREEVLQKSIGALLAPRHRLGTRWIPDERQEITLPGEQYFYELQVQNLSETMTDTFDLRVEPYPWHTSLVTKTLELGPCALGTTLLAVEVPPDAAPDQFSDLRVTAVSRSSRETKATFIMKQKTPGEILLVDDDRFFEQETAYTDSLDALGYTYDVWDTTPNGLDRGGPSAQLLQAYETVLWFTGYDWYAPVRGAENAALTSYMEKGGRLFLSSQDYLFYNWNTPLTRDHLGVLDYQEPVTPTAVFANPDLALPRSLAGPVALQYGPYQNFSDGIIPQESSVPFMWQDTGMLGAVAHAQEHGGRAVFWSLPFETLPAREREAALEGIMGWLSDLGESTFAVNQRYGALGERRTYTLTLRNLPQAPAVTVAISNTLPPGMSLVPGSLNPELRISPLDRTLSWQGRLAPGAEKRFSYQVTLVQKPPAGSQLDNKVTIYNLDSGRSLRKVLPLWINTPNLSQSILSSEATSGLPERRVTYTLGLRNVGLSPAEEVTAVLRLPLSLHVLSETLRSSAGSAALLDRQVVWQGALPVNAAVTTTIALTQAVLSEAWLPAAAIIDDGWTGPLIINDLRYSPPAQRFLPALSAP